MTTKDTRLNKELEKKAVQAFDELNFLLNRLPQYYRFKILSSDKCKKLFETVLDINDVDLSTLNYKTKVLIINVAVQLLADSITVLKTTMPSQFKRSLKNSAMPFLDLLTAITSYGQTNSLKNIPAVKIPDLFRSDEPE